MTKPSEALMSSIPNLPLEQIESNSSSERVDIAIIGAGAAGLMAGIFAARADPRRSVMLLDGAKKLGAKILVAGGGRCNVTHDVVDETAYAGSSRNSIRKVLRRFDVPQTVAFFRELGVELKREETGKLFPVTDDAHTVLNAMLSAVTATGAKIRKLCRVDSIERNTDGFCLSGVWGTLQAGKVILATGGKSLPKSGSDGGGYGLAQSLGHTLTPRITPALVPLTLSRDHWICALSGLTLNTTLELRSASNKRLVSFTNSMLCTHFGLSGPGVLDISRYYLDAHADDSATALYLNWLPELDAEQFDRQLQSTGKATLLRYLVDSCGLPDRLARSLCAAAELDHQQIISALTRGQRRALVQTITACPLPITGNRGYTYAEVTAGGVPLSEIRLETMESRVCPGLYLCGEICDVDGRIGGYNFQWAWSSGYVAGISV
jgi:predicted Rossmann fold flavoprotein